MRGLLLGNDAAVAAWAFRAHGLRPTPVDVAIGIIDPDGTLVGAALLQRFNGYDVEFSYYGEWTLTPGIVRAVARTALGLGARRLTVTVAKDKKQFIKGILRIGFNHECAKVCFYGKNPDKAEHIGMQMVMQHENLQRLAEGRCTLRHKRMFGGKVAEKKRRRKAEALFLARAEAPDKHERTH